MYTRAQIISNGTDNKYKCMDIESKFLDDIIEVILSMVDNGFDFDFVKFSQFNDRYEISSKETYIVLPRDIMFKMGNMDIIDSLKVGFKRYEDKVSK